MANHNLQNRLSWPAGVPVHNSDGLTRPQSIRFGGLRNLTPYRSDFNRALCEYSLGRFEEAKSILRFLTVNLGPVFVAQKKKSEAAQAHLLYASTLAWLGRTYERLDQEKEATSAFTKAKAEFQKWISTPKETPGNIYLDYGVTLFRLGSINGALKAFTKAAGKGSLNAEGNSCMGVCLARLNKSEKAEERFREALRQNPDHLMSRKALAELLERDGRIADAVDEYHTIILQLVGAGFTDEALAITEHILRLTKRDPQLLALKGDILQLQGDFKRALATLNRSLRRQPKNAFANGVKGLVLLRQGKKERGIRLLEQALALDPKNDWVPVEMAGALFNSGEYERALSVLNKALVRNRRNADAQILKGETLSELDRNEEALAAFEKAIEFKPNDALLLAKKGRVLRHLNQYKKAGKALRRSIELEGRTGWVYGELGAVLYGMGQPYDALQVLVDALAIEPDNVFALSYKSEVLRTLGVIEGSVSRTEEALQVINQALALSPKDAWALGTKGQVLRDLGRLEEAIEILMQSIKLHPRLGWVHLEYSTAQYSMGNYNEALEALNKALDLEDDAEWHVFKAQIFCEIGNFKDALQTLDHTIRLTKKLSQAFGLKGWALQHLGEEQAGKALRAYQSAVKLEPDNLWWQKGIANAWYLMGNKRAFAKYKQVLKQAEQRAEGSGDVSFLALRGWCQYRLGNCKAAVELFKKVMSLNVTEIAYQFDLALSLLCNERYAEGLSEYRRGVKRSREEPALRRHGLIRVARDDLRVAMKRHLAAATEVTQSMDLLESNLNGSEDST